MKKIAKMTWLHNGNYGSMLQAVALHRFIADKGYDITEIDYDASIKTKLINWWQNKNSPELFLRKFKEAKKKKAYAHPELFAKRREKFDRFKTENMKLSKLYRSPKELSELINDYDIYICGSDQIWSPALMNPVYYLSFVPKTKIKISYAPSFGVIKTSESKQNQIKGYLKDFDYLSVREVEGQELVQKITGQTVPIQVDPTMLLSREEWKKYAGERIIDKKYIFCYLLTPNKKYIKAVQEIAEKKNLMVVIVPTVKGPFDSGFTEIVDAGPKEWLNYICNSEMVCTDSFHGCIFASIFQKEFILFKRFYDSDKKSENSRVFTLTKMLNVEDRLIDETNIDTIFSLKDMDFGIINEIMIREAHKSSDWLLAILEQECGIPNDE